MAFFQQQAIAYIENIFGDSNKPYLQNFKNCYSNTFRKIVFGVFLKYL